MQVHAAARAISHRSCRLSIAGHDAATEESWRRISHGTSMNRLALTLALYQPDIAQNTGTILRTCACFGAAAAIIEPAGFPASDRHFRRAGMDYLDHVDIARHVSWTAFEAWRAAQRRRLVLLIDARRMRLYGFCLCRRRHPARRAGNGGCAGGRPCRRRRARRHTAAAEFTLAQCRCGSGDRIG